MFQLDLYVDNNKSKLVNPKVKITDDTIEFEMPVDDNVRFLSCTDVSDVLKTFTKKKYDTYRALGNIKHLSIRADGYEVLDTYGARIGMNIHKLGKYNVCVSTIDYTIMEMLRDRIYINDTIYSLYYDSLIQMINVNRNMDSDIVWWPSINTYGKDNFPEYKVFAYEKILDPENAKILKPKTSYPHQPKCNTRKGFIHEDSHFFKINGIKDNSISHTNYKYIKEKLNA